MKTMNFFAFCLLMCLALQLSADAAVDQKSLDAAKQWLSLVDRGEYQQSWKNGSLTFRLTISASHWIGLMKAIREPLGKILSRKVLEQRPSLNPQGLPPGDYMVIFFQSKFSKKRDAHELITLVQESDGNWRVLTYQVQ